MATMNYNTVSYLQVGPREDEGGWGGRRWDGEGKVVGGEGWSQGRMGLRDKLHLLLPDTYIKHGRKIKIN